MGFRDEIGTYLPVSNGESYRLGMGCATIGHAADEDTHLQYQATLRRCLDHGIHYFDTSAQYGGSEFRLGRFLSTIDRNRVFVATKSPVPAALSADEAAQYVKQGVRNSLERLGVSQIDLFQVHDVDRLDQTLCKNGVYDALVACKDMGLIRYIGLATRSHELSMSAIDHGGFDTIITYSDYTPINDSASDLIEYAAMAGLGVINGSPLAFGMLTGKDPRSLGRTDPDYLRTCEAAAKLFDYCVDTGTSVTALAMQFPLGNPNVCVTLTGPGSPEELECTVNSCLHTVPEETWREIAQKCGIALPANLR